MTACSSDPKRTLLALDFDGVLVDSLPEVFTVAMAVFSALEPGWHPGRRPPVPAPGDPVFDRFSELVPLGNGAADFGVSLMAIYRRRAIAGQDDYDAFFQAQPQAWRRVFHDRFYRQRTALRQRDPGAWLGLHRPYAQFLSLLRRRGNRGRLAIATAKDAASVKVLLSHFGIAGLFDPRLVVDNRAGADKRAHLNRIMAQTGTAPDRVVFVDDKVHHLMRVAPLGVFPVLAAWGYNADRERQAARQAGVEVVTLETAEKVLFA
jgi:phosphoglycolate phosphatase-like HAD superfamily hydrolase